MTSVNLRLSDNEIKKDDVIIFSIKSFSESAPFYEAGLLKDGSMFFSYMPIHNLNLAALYERILSKTPQNWRYRAFLETSVKKANEIVDITVSGKASRQLNNIPPELSVLRKDWGWYKMGYGIDEGGFISRVYGITVSGLALQVFESLITENLLKMGYNILVFAQEEPACQVMMDAFMKIETVREMYCKDARI